jgi:hypothetical protein
LFACAEGADHAHDWRDYMADDVLIAFTFKPSLQVAAMVKFD